MHTAHMTHQQYLVVADIDCSFVYILMETDLVATVAHSKYDKKDPTATNRMNSNVKNVDRPPERT